MRTQLVIPALFAGLASAGGNLETRSISAVQAIKEIMPGALSDCSKSDAPTECSTPEQAAPFLIESLKQRTTGEIAMVLSVIGVETADLKYRVNKNPGIPGQGTANMMSPSYVRKYAEFLKLPIEGRSEADILQLVIEDDFNHFNSAVWFINQECTEDVKAKMRMGTDEGYKLYLEKCIVTENSDLRQAYWARAKKVFNLTGK
ncbi:hypothetical protein B0T20DRAFT_479925 [Sordaria brevicollis]|uniref:Uncharacterized protein n=1 Tax=Sordaria brevicollis TaxID=83679 RepID=A0AAE0PD89_SORBR|nr:hypothetical protein B0T20DRAFT_479925 [Sordaria brevicollis]